MTDKSVSEGMRRLVFAVPMSVARSNGSRGAARSRIDQLHLQTRLAGRPSPTRSADREGRLKQWARTLSR